MSHQTQMITEEKLALRNTDRRAWIRLPCDLEGTCQPLTAVDKTRWSARVIGISRGGLKLRLRRRFEAGTLLQIDLASPNETTPQTLMVRIVYAVPEDDGFWAMGCTLARLLTADEVKAMEVAPPAQSHSGETLGEAP